MKSTRFLPLIIFICTLLGCSNHKASPTTVGLRIFDENPRLFNDDIKIAIYTQNTHQLILKTHLKNAYTWSPTQIHQLKPNTPLILEIHYALYAPPNQKTKTRVHKTVIPMDDNYDIYIHWDPPMDTPISNDQITKKHWNRKPSTTLTKGHPPVF